MGVRLILAGLAGALAMFVWTSIAHMMTPLGEAGISMPPDDRVAMAMKESLGSRGGFYLFPTFEMKPGQEAAGMAAYAQKLKTSPKGLIVYQPPGSPDMEPRMFVAEFALEFAQALLAAFLLSLTAIRGFAGRVGFVALLGLVAAITTNGSYWNWHAFPLTYTLAYGFTQWVGFVAAGVAIALVLGRGTAKPG